jgi:hypothetical protein
MPVKILGISFIHVSIYTYILSPYNPDPAKKSPRSFAEGYKILYGIFLFAHQQFCRLDAVAGLKFQRINAVFKAVYIYTNIIYAGMKAHCLG